MQQVSPKVMRFFSSLADQTRLKIVLSLVERPKTVNEIHAEVGGITLSAISHQLRQLHDADIVMYEKAGRQKVFQLSDAFCWCILRDAMSHFKGKTKCPECSRLGKSLKW